MKVNLKRVLKTTSYIVFASILLFTLITIIGGKIESNCIIISSQVVGDKGNMLLEPNGDELAYYKNGGKIPWRIREQLKCEREQMKPILVFGGLIFISVLVAVFMWKKRQKHRTRK